MRHFLPAASRTSRVLFTAAAVILLLTAPPPVRAEEPPGSMLDLGMDSIDSLFDAVESASETDAGESLLLPAAAPRSTPVTLQSRGFSVDFSATATAFASPGWAETPWNWNEENLDDVYVRTFGAALNSTAGLDVRFSREFRIRATFNLSITPAYNENQKTYSIGASPYPSLGDFFLDYSVADTVFFRAGKLVQNWGISRSFPSANLPSRIPAGVGGDSYLVKADIPVGVGGVQLLALLRPGFLEKDVSVLSSFGYGAKYNLALPRADIDAGFFYHEKMPLRAFVSLKITLFGTELYAESMGAVRHETWDGFSVSGNLGFARSFFNDVLSVNGEIFWNGEDNAYWFDPGNELREAESSPFISGLNAALNFSVNPGWPWDIRFVFRGLWALENNTFYLMPGITANPLPNLAVSLGFPLVLGSRDGHYYRNNSDPLKRPFAVMLLFSLSGSYRYARYE